MADQTTTTSADIRARLVDALRLDLVGPESGDPQVTETLFVPPSRWYLTGPLVPWAAPASQKHDDDTQGELAMTAAGGAGADDDAPPEPQAARRGHFPSSLGVSVLVPTEATHLRVTARWGDYAPRKVGTKPDVEWDRRERQETVTVSLAGSGTEPKTSAAPDSGGLEIVTSVRRISQPQNLQGLQPGTRAVSLFLVNRRTPREGRDELKDERFIFQAKLIVEADDPFVPRPNSRGRDVVPGSSLTTYERIGPARGCPRSTTIRARSRPTRPCGRHGMPRASSWMTRSPS